jgi:hypothetical protein
MAFPEPLHKEDQQEYARIKVMGIPDLGLLGGKVENNSCKTRQDYGQFATWVAPESFSF